MNSKEELETSIPNSNQIVGREGSDGNVTTIPTGLSIPNSQSEPQRDGSVSLPPSKSAINERVLPSLNHESNPSQSQIQTSKSILLPFHSHLIISEKTLVPVHITSTTIHEFSNLKSLLNLLKEYWLNWYNLNRAKDKLNGSKESLRASCASSRIENHQNTSLDASTKTKSSGNGSIGVKRIRSAKASTTSKNAKIPKLSNESLPESNHISPEANGRKDLSNPNGINTSTRSSTLNTASILNHSNISHEQDLAHFSTLSNLNFDWNAEKKLRITSFLKEDAFDLQDNSYEYNISMKEENGRYYKLKRIGKHYHSFNISQIGLHIVVKERSRLISLLKGK